MLFLHRAVHLTLVMAASLMTFTVMLLPGGCRRAPAQPPAPPPPVSVSRPVEEQVVEWDEYTGHLDAVEMVEVRARVTGFIVSAPFKEGSVVKKGEVLFEIDVRPFQAELDARTADVARAEAQLSLAEIEYNRTKGLLAQEAAPPIEFQTATANLGQAKAGLAAAKAAVESAQLNVEWCRVTAPIAGRVGRIEVKAGNLISGGTGQATLLTTITSIDPVYCYFTVPEQAVLKYQRLAREKKRPSGRQGTTPCYMELENETGFPHEGVIDFINNRLDPTTGTMLVRGVFPNPQGWLTPGFFARVRVPGSGRYPALLVPDAAVVTNQNQRLLYVVGPDNTAQARPIKLGALFGLLRAVQEGVGPDDRVIVDGQMRVRPGVKVSVREVPVSVESAQLTSAGSTSGQNSPTTQPTSSTQPGTQPAERPAKGAERSAPAEKSRTGRRRAGMASQSSSEAKAIASPFATGKLRRVRTTPYGPPWQGGQSLSMAPARAFAGAASVATHEGRP